MRQKSSLALKTHVRCEPLYRAKQVPMNHTDYLQTFPKTDPWSLLSADRARMAISIRDYMLGSGRMNGDPDTTLTKLSHRIVDAGVPLDRCVTIVRILHAINTASYRMWEKDNGTTSFAIP